MMEKNKPYLAFEKKSAVYNEKLKSWIIADSKTKTLYDGRYCAVSGFIYAIVNGKYCILANLRGKGTPDYQGFWNAPCGYLERGENSKQGIAREIYEECGLIIDMDKLEVVHTETEPAECNHGNVTIRHRAYLGNIGDGNLFIEKSGGEENEVDDVKWIPVDDLDNYKWAFNHYKIIKKYAAPKWKRWILEKLSLR